MLASFVVMRCCLCLARQAVPQCCARARRCVSNVALERLAPATPAGHMDRAFDPFCLGGCGATACGLLAERLQLQLVCGVLAAFGSTSVGLCV